VSSFSRIIADDFAAPLDPQGQHFLTRIQESAGKMESLINGLLSFSRAGRKALTRHAVDLREMAQDVYNELREAQDPARQIEFTLGTLPTASVDPTLFKQVFSNLISNALKYTGKREIARIEVGTLAPHQLPPNSANLEGEKEGGLIIFIRDNGTGFDMKYADKLFGVFQRLHSEAEFDGTGIGLSTVARIIQKHGGHIWAEAELDKGATFYFTLGKGE
jgi:signal transduction histidine kinase